MSTIEASSSDDGGIVNLCLRPFSQPWIRTDTSIYSSGSGSKLTVLAILGSAHEVSRSCDTDLLEGVASGFLEFWELSATIYSKVMEMNLTSPISRLDSSESLQHRHDANLTRDR